MSQRTDRTPQEQAAHDEAIAEKKRLGIPVEEEEEAAPAAPAPETPSPTAPEATPETPAAPEKPAEGAPANAEPQTPAAPATPAAQEPGAPSAEAKPEVVTRALPPKYIPIPKYQHEKAQWDQDKARLEAEVARLSSIVAPAEAAAQEAEIAKAAEALGATPESVKAIIELARKGFSPTTAAPAAVAPVAPAPEATPQQPAPQAQPEQQPQQVDEEAFFAQELAAAVPALQEVSANATPSQLEDAKAKLKELAYLPKYASWPLEAIIAAHKAELSDVMARPNRVSAEPGSGKGGITDTGAKKKPDLSTLAGIQEYERQMRAEAEAEEAKGLRVMRNGQEIRV